MPVSCECFFLSSSGLRTGLNCRPELSSNECGVPEYDCEALTMRKPWLTTGCAIKNIFSECGSVALVIQLAQNMSSMILSSLAYLDVTYFSAFSYKRHDFREIVFENKIYVLMFSTSFVRNISHSKNNSASYCRKSA